MAEIEVKLRCHDYWWGCFVLAGLCLIGCDLSGGNAVEGVDSPDASSVHLSINDWVGCFYLTYGDAVPEWEADWEWGAFYVLPGEIRVDRPQGVSGTDGRFELAARSIRSEQGYLVARVESDYWSVKTAGDSLHLHSKSIFNSRDLRVSATGGDSLVGVVEVRAGDNVLYRRTVRGSKRDCYLGIPIPLMDQKAHRERP